MRIVVAELSAVYSGRGETLLPPHERVVMLKEDGSVSIHSEKGYKPINYMTSSNELQESTIGGDRVWSFLGKDESLVIRFHRLYSDSSLPLGGEDPGHTVKLGQEKQLQLWLTTRLGELEPGLRFLEREHQTGAGPVDLLAERPDGALMALEVKRVAPMTSVGQILRYRDALEELHPERPVVGALAAVEFKARTLTLAKKKGILCFPVPADWVFRQEAGEPLVSPRPGSHPTPLERLGGTEPGPLLPGAPEPDLL